MKRRISDMNGLLEFLKFWRFSAEQCGLTVKVLITYSGTQVLADCISSDGATLRQSRKAIRTRSVRNIHSLVRRDMKSLFSWWSKRIRGRILFKGGRM